MPAEGNGDLQILILVLVARLRRCLTTHIVESCLLTKLNGGLSRLHSADEDAVSFVADQLLLMTRIREEEDRNNVKTLLN